MLLVASVPFAPYAERTTAKTAKIQKAPAGSSKEEVSKAPAEPSSMLCTVPGLNYSAPCVLFDLSSKQPPRSALTTLSVSAPGLASFSLSPLTCTLSFAPAPNAAGSFALQAVVRLASFPSTPDSLLIKECAVFQCESSNAFTNSSTVACQATAVGNKASMFAAFTLGASSIEENFTVYPQALFGDAQIATNASCFNFTSLDLRAESLLRYSLELELPSCSPPHYPPTASFYSASLYGLLGKSSLHQGQSPRLF